jgi:hypothetical protein
MGFERGLTEVLMQWFKYYFLIGIVIKTPWL